MPQFKPFKGIRPVKELAGLFTTKSVDNYSEEELEAALSSNPDSFLQIIKPTWEDAETEAELRYREVRKNFLAFFESEKSEQDKTSFYIYQVIKPGEIPIQALIGIVSMDDYAEGKIKKHEETLTKRVNLFADYLQQVHFHAEPVLLTYPHNQRVDLLMEIEMRRSPVASFKDQTETNHTLWKVENRLNILQLKESIERNESLYIADGHHRMESSLAYSKRMMRHNKDFDDADDVNFTLAMLISDKELIIKDYNRLIKDLNGLSSQEFLDKLAQEFEFAERGDTPFFPSKKHHFGLYMDGKFYSLYAGRIEKEEEGLTELDTYLFEEYVLKPILDIQDSRDDDRLGFVRGTGDINGVLHLKNTVDSGKYKAGFFFYPVAAKDLEKIADLGLKMPPKSTYIEPKPLSGLTIFQLNE
ncbi:MAG: DUF1015 domain-containing protein [Weeksellaceae bacterium]